MSLPELLSIRAEKRAAVVTKCNSHTNLIHRYGRVITYQIGSLGGLVFGIASAFSQNIFVFTALRFIQVVFFFPTCVCTVVYGTWPYTATCILI